VTVSEGSVGPPSHYRLASATVEMFRAGHFESDTERIKEPVSQRIHTPLEPSHRLHNRGALS